MSVRQGSNEAQDATTTTLVESFVAALKERIGEDRFRLWFTHGVTFCVEQPHTAVVSTSGPFAADRIKKSFLGELRWAALVTLGDAAMIRVDVEEQTSAPEKSARPTAATEPAPAPAAHAPAPAAHPPAAHPPAALAPARVKAAPTSMAPRPADGPAPDTSSSLDSFVVGPCNDFAYSAVTMAIASPQVASPLFLHGPAGCGKSHLLAAMAQALRTRRRMRRVILLTAEEFTNDFIASVGTTGLPAFRSRYRDVDALLIDDVHFLAAKPATLREILYTVETLSASGKALVFAANTSPAEIRGLTNEVAGRMSSGLVCPLLPIDDVTRLSLLKRVTGQRCPLGCDEEMLAEVSGMIGGDARAVSGIANLIGMLQRMFRREPTIAEIRQFGGDLLRNRNIAPTLRGIERAVCDIFGLDINDLRGKAQTRRVSEPRMLAMYLARQLTGTAFTEIAQHFGRRSHSNAIAAQNKVQTWLQSGRAIGGGSGAMSASDAVSQIQAKLRVG